MRNVSIQGGEIMATGGASWRMRFRAWWEGDESLPDAPPAPVIHRAPPPVASPVTASTAIAEVAPTTVAWPAPRMALIQQLFGTGMHTPGGLEAVEGLLAPLDLHPGSALLEIGAGLGSVARAAIARGATIQAFEMDTALVLAANAISAELDPAHPVEIRQGAYDRLKMPVGTLDGIIAREALLPWANKSRVLGQMRKLLKPGGKLVFSDWARTCEPTNPTLAIWAMYEPAEPHLMSVDEMRLELEDLGFAVAMEDLSVQYRHWVTTAFAGHAERLLRKPPDARAQAWAISETEFWTRRISLLQTGDLAMPRFVATVPAGGR